MFKELRLGFANYPIWTRLALDDLTSTYKLSVFGYLWEPISYIFMVVALSPLYAMLMNIELSWYLTYFSAGWIVWRFMSGIIISSCSTYTESARYITQTNQPLSIYSYKVVLSHFYRLLLNLPILIVIILLFSDISRVSVAGVLLALILFSIMGFSMSIIIGYMTLKLRDLRAVVDNVMRIAFFVTPVIWLDETVMKVSSEGFNFSSKTAYLDLNPLYHFLVVMRSPLLGEVVPKVSFSVVLFSTSIFFLISVIVLKRCKRNIPYLV